MSGPIVTEASVTYMSELRTTASHVGDNFDRKLTFNPLKPKLF
jgi:hypothetical protein